jgi:O-antigen/teichoic acid export membrane protein
MNLAAGPLRALVVKSMAWYGATRLWGQIVSWVVTVLLARLLVPHDYGLFAMVLSVLSILELLQEFGLGTALIQRQDLTRQQVNAVFWVVAAASVLLAGATFVASDLIGRTYGEPELAWPLRLLCLSFVLNSMGVVPSSLLTKAINLRQRSLAEAFGTTASALVVLVLAFLGYGVTALVIGYLARAVLMNLLLSCFAGWLPGIDVDLDGLWRLLTFGVRIAGTHLVGAATTATVIFILAKLLSATAVGLYAMAQSLSDAPSRLSTAIINQVSLPLFSKIQDDRVLLAAAFLKISRYLALVAVPAQIGLALVAPDLVPVLLSSQWEPLTRPFQILCLESCLVLSTLTCSPLLLARGRANLLFNQSLLSFVGVTAAALVGAPFGLVGVMLARLIIMISLRLLLLIPALSELELSPTAYARTLAPSLYAATLMSAAVYLVRYGWPLQNSRLELLVLSITTGAVTYVASVLWFDRTLRADLRAIARDVAAPTIRP